MADIGRVFLVGCPRSGTTLVQSMLAANTAVHTLPETHFFSRIIPNSKWARRCGLTDKKVRDFLAQKLAEITGTSDVVPTGFRTLFVAPYGRAFAHFMDTQATAQNKKIWVDKTPQHLHRISRIVDSVPDAKFVHILRAWQDTIASLYHVTQEYPDRWGGAQSIEQCADRWVQDIRVSQEYLNDQKHFFLLYDDLLKNPETILSRLSDFVNVEFQERMLSDSSAAYHRTVAEEDADWTGDAGRPLRQQADRGKFQTYLTDDQRSRVESAVSAAGLADLHEIFSSNHN